MSFDVISALARINRTYPRSVPLAHALLILGALVAAAVVVGVLWRLQDGRRRRGTGTVDVSALGIPSGAISLVLFSTETCSRCPQVRRMLQSVASVHPGVEVVDVDLTHRPDVAARHRVLSTPTVLLVGEDAVVTARFVGVPRREDVEAVLSERPVLQEAS